MSVYSKKQKKGCRSRMANRRAWRHGVGYDTRQRYWFDLGKDTPDEPMMVTGTVNLGILMARYARKYGV